MKGKIAQQFRVALVLLVVIFARVERSQVVICINGHFRLAAKLVFHASTSEKRKENDNNVKYI